MFNFITFGFYLGMWRLWRVSSKTSFGACFNNFLVGMDTWWPDCRVPLEGENDELHRIKSEYEKKLKTNDFDLPYGFDTDIFK